MSRADGSAYPPLPSDADVRSVRDVLHRSMGDEGWSVEQVVVGEHVHLVAKCFCASCMAIREEQDERDFRERPQHRMVGWCSLPLAECEECSKEARILAQMREDDRREEERRAEWRKESPGLRAWRESWRKPA